MERPIKFRAWNTVTRKMFPHDALKAMTVLATNGIEGLFIPDDTQLEWDQSTGFRDRTGKEIYENDLVKWYKAHWDEEDPRDTIHQVIYSRGAFRLSVAREDDPEFNLEGWTLEIVGNIHENPELYPPGDK